jgi:hypothetical protein
VARTFQQGLSGERLVHEGPCLHPGIRVLFTSGYAQGLLSAQCVLEPRLYLIEKPFLRDLTRHQAE